MIQKSANFKLQSWAFPPFWHQPPQTPPTSTPYLMATVFSCFFFFKSSRAPTQSRDHVSPLLSDQLEPVLSASYIFQKQIVDFSIVKFVLDRHTLHSQMHRSHASVPIFYFLFFLIFLFIFTCSYVGKLQASNDICEKVCRCYNFDYKISLLALRSLVPCK